MFPAEGIARALVQTAGGRGLRSGVGALPSAGCNVMLGSAEDASERGKLGGTAVGGEGGCVWPWQGQEGQGEPDPWDGGTVRSRTGAPTPGSRGGKEATHTVWGNHVHGFYKAYWPGRGPTGKAV